jgi:hypothetical protein
LAEAFSSQLASGEDLDVAPNPLCGFYKGGDVWFQFQAPPMGNFTLNVPSGDPNLMFYTGSCGSFTEILCSADDEISFDDPSLGDQTIYVRAYQFNSRQGADFELCLQSFDAPPNDNCDDAITLTVSETCSFEAFDAFNATDEVGVAADPTCGTYNGSDVWFTIDVPASGRFAIRRNNLSGNFGYSLYSGSCGTFTAELCSTTPTQTIYIDPTLAGQTVYLRVYNQSNTANGMFELCVFQVDCFGIPEGTAFLDGCGECVGGQSGATDCAFDCNGDLNGAAFVDNCGFCVGGNTGNVWKAGLSLYFRENRGQMYYQVICTTLLGSVPLQPKLRLSCPIRELLLMMI